MKNTTLFFLGLFLFLSSFAFAKNTEFDYQFINQIAVQDQGRIKPLQTFFKDSVFLISKKLTSRKNNPTQVCLSWLSQPEKYELADLMYLKSKNLKKIIQLDLDKVYFSPFQIAHNEVFRKYLNEIDVRRDKGVTLNATEKEAVALFEQVNRFYGIAQGTQLNVVPFDVENNRWLSPIDLIPGSERAESMSDKFRYDFLAVMATVIQSFKNEEIETFKQSSKTLISIQKSIGESSGNLIPEKLIQLELFFNQFKPFHLVWKLFAFAVLAYFVPLFFPIIKRTWLFLPLFMLAFVSYTFTGFSVILLLGYFPLSNLCDFANVVSWCCSVLALWFALKDREMIYCFFAAIISLCVLLFFIPMSLEYGFPMEAFQQLHLTNLLYSFHVSFLTFAYAAFVFTFFISHCLLGLFFLKKDINDNYKRLNVSLIQLLRFGLLGYVFGVISASLWNRQLLGEFWGIEAKYVGSLLIILAYSINLHLRLINRVTEHLFLMINIGLFHMLLFASLYGFSLVPATLKPSGGMLYFLVFIPLEMSFAALCYWLYLQPLPRRGKILKGL